MIKIRIIKKQHNNTKNITTTTTRFLALRAFQKYCISAF